MWQIYKYITTKSKWWTNNIGGIIEQLELDIKALKILR